MNTTLLNPPNWFLHSQSGTAQTCSQMHMRELQPRSVIKDGLACQRRCIGDHAKRNDMISLQIQSPQTLSNRGAVFPVHRLLERVPVAPKLKVHAAYVLTQAMDRAPHDSPIKVCEKLTFCWVQLTGRNVSHEGPLRCTFTDHEKVKSPQEELKISR